MNQNDSKDKLKVRGRRGMFPSSSSVRVFCALFLRRKEHARLQDREVPDGYSNERSGRALANKFN